MSIFRKIFIGITIAIVSHTHAAELPFTDVNPRADYYEGLESLYHAGIISDDGTHLFRPNALMTRDFYVSLAVGIGCKECEVPSIEDIMRYTTSPFVDLKKTNPYYYCIAYAAENNITHGYNIDPATNQASCEDRKIYTTSPFCEANTISRIEAAAILLRRVNLWNEGLNASVTRTISIPDASDYWYGYARKGIDVKIIQQKQDNTIGQDEKITRAEFVKMAARILAYSQCNTNKNTNTIESAIGIRDAQDSPIKRNRFVKGEKFSFVPIVSDGKWEYKWTATRLSDGSIVRGEGDRLHGERLDTGNWNVVLEVIDPNSKKVVSKPSITVTIVEKESDPKFPCVSLIAQPLSTGVDTPIQFNSTVCDTGNNLTYSWDYGDGTRGSDTGNSTHTYNTPGTYTVTLTITDTVTGNTAQSTVIVRITGEKDTDGDGIPDSSDQCPLVYGPKPTGCPVVPIYDIDKEITGGGKSPKDTDGDGIPDSSDQCPLVYGPKPTGCPVVPQDDGWFLGNNICLENKLKTQGLFIGKPYCGQCPCDKSITITAPLRSCDIVFPSIMSPERDKLYSRGGFFTVP